MITPDDILEEYTEVDDDRVVDYLCESNQLGALLTAIVKGRDTEISSYILILKAMADARRYKLASDIALDKYLAMKKSADMKDED